uniref:Uncharacterized protein n=1 Tax=Cucumis melo TaxID=3656 RepID=A0A9I9EEX4_CUCME
MLLSEQLGTGSARMGSLSEMNDLASTFAKRKNPDDMQQLSFPKVMISVPTSIATLLKDLYHLNKVVTGTRHPGVIGDRGSNKYELGYLRKKCKKGDEKFLWREHHKEPVNLFMCFCPWTNLPIPFNFQMKVSKKVNMKGKYERNRHRDPLILLSFPSCRMF